MADNENTNTVSDAQLGWMLGFFTLGAFMGAMTALLLATQRGEETRADIRQGFDDVKVKLNELGEQAKVRSKELAEKSREMFEEKKNVVKSALEAGREAAKKAKDESTRELAASNE